ncbi:NAD-dependent epimerase/dehydratase family protein [Eggerthellaceae bacterium 24-137]
MKVLVTGAGGFVGKNLCENLKNIRDGKNADSAFRTLLPLEILEYDRASTKEDLAAFCSEADFVFHLAGVNRPKDIREFMKGNFDLTSELLAYLREAGNRCPVMFASSIQAALSGRFADSEYGKSKLAGEELVFSYGDEVGAEVLVYRLPNLYGKWCRPNYNSVIATFCHNIANGLPVEVSDPSIALDLLYIDDLVDEMMRALLGNPTTNGRYCVVHPVDRVRLGDIEALLRSFERANADLEIPEVLPGSFGKKLYSTYQSYLPEKKMAYKLDPHRDDRGSFVELFRTIDRGQVSVNVSKPGVTKGQHWHNTKWEKFCVISGCGLIRQRKIGFDDNGEEYPIAEIEVCGEEPMVVEVLPGYTHSITNLSETQDLITIMWCNEVFDPARPDTFFSEV